MSTLRTEIIEAIRDLAPYVSASTFVEYGYYADRTLLTEMASIAGGSLVFADQFDKYEPAVEASVAGGASERRVNVLLPKDVEPLHGIVFALGVNDYKIYTFEPHHELGVTVVSVPEGLVERVLFLTTRVTSEIADRPDIDAGPVRDVTVEGADETLYAAAHVFMRAGKSKIVKQILTALGDVALINAFAGCYGKQKHTEVMEMARGAAFDASRRFVAGRDMNHKFDPNAYTIVDLLSFLQRNGDSVAVLLDDVDFKYSRISRQRVDASDLMTDAQVAEVERLTDAIGTCRDIKKIKTLVAELDKLRASFGEGGIKFRADRKPNGYPVLDLTWNENRPNVSMLVRKTGTLDLIGRIPEALTTKIPVNFPTHVFRNYALVRDGMINVETLPVRIEDAALVAELRGLLGSRIHGSDKHYTIDLRGMPVVNDTMVETVPAASEMFGLQHALQLARCAQKVLKFYRDERVVEEKPATLVDRYGKDGADFLASIGVGYNGFAPVSTKQTEAKDFYLGTELDVELKGLMTLPSVNDVKKRLDAGKALTGAAARMAEIIHRVEGQRVVLGDAFGAWVDAEADSAITLTRSFIRQIARMKYAMVLGQSWFSDAKTFGEASAKLTLEGREVECSAKLENVEIYV